MVDFTNDSEFSELAIHLRSSSRQRKCLRRALYVQRSVWAPVFVKADAIRVHAVAFLGWAEIAGREQDHQRDDAAVFSAVCGVNSSCGPPLLPWTVYLALSTPGASPVQDRMHDVA